MHPYLLFALVLLATSCAKVGLPSGGPVDKEAPRILSHYPAADALEVARDEVVEIAFSEAMDRERTEEALFVSPAGPLQLKWRGTTRLQVAMPLAEERTYVLTVGTGARDVRGNSLAQSFTLAFATGSQLDQGAVRGRVWRDHQPAPRAHVWAYDLETFAGRIGFDEPSYKTQSGSDGAYEFARLAESRYRVLAFADDNRNALPDAGEWLALPAADVVVGAAQARAGDLVLARSGDEAPVLNRVQAVHDGRVLLHFASPVDVAVLDLAIDGLGVAAIYADPGAAEKVYVETPPHEPGREYAIARLALAGAAIAWEQPVRGSDRADRKPPVLAVSGQRRLAPGDPFELVFSEAMQPGALDDFWIAGDSTQVPAGVWDWPAANRARYIPTAPLAPGAHRLEGRPELLADRAGNVLADSALVISFEVDAATATIRGEVQSAVGPVRVEAIGEDGRTFAAVVDTAGRFALDGLLAGSYTLWTFADLDGDGRRGMGALDPFMAAEPYGRHPEPLELETGQAVEVELLCY